MVTTTPVQKSFIKKFFNTGKEAYCSPGNEFCVALLDSNDAFDLDQAADTHTTDNIMFPFPVEITEMVVKQAEAFDFDTTEGILGLVEPGDAITTAANCYAAFTFATGGAAGDCTAGTYSGDAVAAAGNVLAADTNYEVGIVQQIVDSGTTTGQVDSIMIYARQIPNTET